MVRLPRFFFNAAAMMTCLQCGRYDSSSRVVGLGPVPRKNVAKDGTGSPTYIVGDNKERQCFPMGSPSDRRSL